MHRHRPPTLHEQLEHVLVHLHEQRAEFTCQFDQLKGLIMATAAEFTAGFDRVDAATNAIAALIRTLVERQQSGSMTAAEETAAQNKLLQVADALEAMAATPTDPVPVSVPT